MESVNAVAGTADHSTSQGMAAVTMEQLERPATIEERVSSLRTHNRTQNLTLIPAGSEGKGREE